MAGKENSSSAHELVIVSGLPRSGTSMMMKMLAAGGVEPVADNLRIADEDNLLGYFEDERVKNLAKDNSWITGELRGRVLKVISMLLYNLPGSLEYRVVFIRRNIREVLASQRKMLARRGVTDTGPADEVMAAKFEEHLSKVDEWLEQRSNFNVLYIDYAEVVAEPEKYAAMVKNFLEMGLDVEAMAAAVKPSMYRNRAD